MRGFLPTVELYVKGGMYTVYSSDTGLTINDFFTRPNYFYHAEVGWSGSAGQGVPIQAFGRWMPTIFP